ncbi:MAG: hypothetical protein S4CHLAM37_15020 [Chlamydiia bacterium]|nr:hypothetical protein [Chlamydiia bacterium]
MVRSLQGPEARNVAQAAAAAAPATATKLPTLTDAESRTASAASALKQAPQAEAKKDLSGAALEQIPDVAGKVIKAVSRMIAKIQAPTTDLTAQMAKNGALNKAITHNNLLNIEEEFKSGSAGTLTKSEEDKIIPKQLNGAIDAYLNMPKALEAKQGASLKKEANLQLSRFVNSKRFKALSKTDQKRALTSIYQRLSESGPKTRSSGMTLPDTDDFLERKHAFKTSLVKQAAVALK